MKERFLLKTCKRCFTIYHAHDTSDYCPKCVQAIEQAYRIVKIYVKENPNADINEVASECMISHKLLRQWVYEGKLAL